MTTAAQPVVSHHTDRMMATTLIKPEESPVPVTHDGNDEFMVIYAGDGTPMTSEQVTAYLQDALDSADRGEGRSIEEVCRKYGIDYDSL